MGDLSSIQSLCKAGDEFVLILRAQDVNETPMTTYGVVIIKVN